MALRSKFIIDGKMECSKCHKWQLVSEFYARAGTPTGLMYECKACNAAKAVAWNERNFKRLSVHRKTAQRKRKIAVLKAYSGGTPKCACCGEAQVEFLTIDHIDGNGWAHRRVSKVNFYAWLIREEFPDGLQVLCYNCNCAKKNGPKCPHQL